MLSDKIERKKKQIQKRIKKRTIKKMTLNMK
jgi:hypothetical protein